jgi:hypothetical protein
MGREYRNVEDVKKRIELPLTGVSDDGSFYGTVTKEMREEINFDELMDESDEVRGYAVICFE